MGAFIKIVRDRNTLELSKLSIVIEQVRTMFRTRIDEQHPRNIQKYLHKRN